MTSFLTCPSSTLKIDSRISQKSGKSAPRNFGNESQIAFRGTLI